MQSSLARIVFAAAAFFLAAGCGEKEQAKPAPAATRVTGAAAEARDIELLEHSVGVVETPSDARIAAEVAGRVLRVLVAAGDTVKAGQPMAVLDAQDLVLRGRASRSEVKRLEALLANERRTVERNRRLVAERFIAPSVLDESLARQTALAEQIAGERARLAQIERDIGRARVTAPFDGRVQAQVAAAGDYVKVGDPLFHLVSDRGLRVRLPLPETALPRIAPGQEVRLVLPAAPDKAYRGRIEAIEPMIGSANRAMNAIVTLREPLGWRPGASVDAAIVVGRRAAVVVPEAAVVQRPAGTIVYVVESGRAAQRVVKAGVAREGWVEILEGLAAGATVAVDGAGFLTDKAAVAVEERRR